jgi:hypothetical protein
VTIPGIATKWEISSDGLTTTFTKGRELSSMMARR